MNCAHMILWRRTQLTMMYIGQSEFSAAAANTVVGREACFAHLPCPPFPPGFPSAPGVVCAGLQRSAHHSLVRIFNGRLCDTGGAAAGHRTPCPAPPGWKGLLPNCEQPFFETLRATSGDTKLCSRL